MTDYAPPAYTHRVDAMRQILSLLARGNTRFVAGKCPLRAAPVHAAKHAAYGAFLDEQTRYRYKKKGLASVRAVYLLDESNQRVFWWLFVSDGEGLIKEMEDVKNALNKNTRVLIAGYECLRMPRKGTDGSPWTWQISTEKYTRLEGEIVKAIRTKDFRAMRQWNYSLRRSPSFAGVRRQCYRLAARADAEWKRGAKGKSPLLKFAMGWQGRYKKARTVQLFNPNPLRHLKATAAPAAPEPPE